MFTDGPVTPVRVEILIDLMRGLSVRRIDRALLAQLLQPEGLPSLDPKKRVQAQETLKAALDLGIMTEDADGTLKLIVERKDKRTAKQILLAALDEVVISSTEVEPYFSLFYSYLLSLNADGCVNRSNSEWAVDFERDVFGGQRVNNPFNEVKLTGLHRWLSYAGLGWYDISEVFQPNPYERLRRRLGAIFAGEAKLTGEEFMRRLSEACPELDGGAIFRRADRGYDPAAKVCTLGLSHALIDLHQDGWIRLDCPRDSRGWSIEAAAPPGDSLQSGRIDTVELVKVTE
ncbi:MAG: hypothetical protein HONDAALG_03908 [Gammaproteobacteria bacterium]|nr:hypothetical protein [Gammaproteobacteria bacterium]